jgi:hypothetical protein
MPGVRSLRARAQADSADAGARTQDYVESMDGRATQFVGLVMSLVIVGCGGGGHASSTDTSSMTTSTASRTGGTAAVLTGPVRASLHAESHAPVQGRNWAYAVRVSNAAGRPLSGSVEIQFVFGGQVVGRDTPPSHPVRRGSWHDRIIFPPAAVGQPLTFRAVVHTSLGSVTLDWPIKVRS